MLRPRLQISLTTIGFAPGNQTGRVYSCQKMSFTHSGFGDKERNLKHLCERSKVAKISFQTRFWNLHFSRFSNLKCIKKVWWLNEKQSAGKNKEFLLDKSAAAVFALIFIPHNTSYVIKVFVSKHLHNEFWQFASPNQKWKSLREYKRQT